MPPSPRPVEPFRALTGLRGLAAWWVVAYHFRDALPDSTPASIVDFVGYGYLAVDLFFVLSGYVIALNYSGWFTEPRAQRALYPRFLWLRLSRIYPLHAVLLLLFLLNPLAAVLAPHHHALGNLHWGYYALSFLLAQAWGLIDGPAWNVPAWSISTEWLAYLAFPWLAQLAMRVTRGLLGTLAFVVACALALAVCGSVRGDRDGMQDFQWFGVARCVCEFSMGIGVFRLTIFSAQTRTTLVAGFVLAVACFIAFAAEPGLEYAVLPIGFAALIYGLTDESGIVAILLRYQPLQWLGVVSYSTYLSHYLLKTWVKFAVLRPGVPPAYAFFAYLLAVLAASAVLHHGVERPGQRVARNLLFSKPREALP